MKLRSGKITGIFDKQLILHFEKYENTKARKILQRSPRFFKMIDNQGCTLLHHAAECNNSMMVKYLIDSKVAIDVQDINQGRTALMIASFSDNYKNADVTAMKVKELLLANAQVHLRDNAGVSALQMVIRENLMHTNVQELCVSNLIAQYSNNNEEIIKLLLECDNLLHNLVYTDKQMLARFFLQIGYPVDAKINQTGDTALHHAVKSCNLDYVKLLLEFGADVNAKNSKGNTPISFLKLSQRDTCTILKILLDHGAFTTSLNNSGFMQIWELLVDGNTEEIQLLLRYNVNLHAKDKMKRTVVHYLAENECENILELLEGMDFDVNDEDKDELTPLHCAVGNRSSMGFLLKKGADVNAMDDESVTPLHVAFSFACDIPSIELLLEYGADPQTKDGYGSTIIEEAIRLRLFIQISPVLAHLVILAAKGVKIEKYIRQEIHDNDQLKMCYKLHTRKLKRMKNAKIWRSITLYKLIMEQEDKLIPYIRNKGLILKLVRLNKRYVPKWNYYYDVLRKRMDKMIRNAQLKSRAAIVICELMESHYGASHIMSNKIVDYLDNKDLLTLVCTAVT